MRQDHTHHPRGFHEGIAGTAAADVPPREAEPSPGESAEAYKFLLDHSRDIILILNKRGQILYCNNSCLTGFGYSREDIIGKSLVRFLTKASVKKAFFALAQEFLGRPQPTLELEVKSKSGKIRHISVAESSAPLYKNGRITGVMITASDITEQCLAMSELQESQKRYEDLWENAPVAYHTADTRGVITDANQTEARILGYEKEELVGRSVFELMPPEQRADAQERFHKKITGRQVPKSMDRVLIRKDGSRIHVAVDDSLERNGDGTITGIRSTLVNITKLRESEEALKKSEEHFRDLVEKSGIAILIDDRNGNISYFNARFAEIFGYSPEEIKKQTIWTCVHPDDAAMLKRFHRARVRGEQVPSRYEIKGIRKDGSTIFLEVDVVTVKEGERLVGTRSHMWDITDRKLAQEKHREYEERFRSIAEYSHDAILFVDDAFRVIYANPESSRVLGYPNEEVVGRSFIEFLAADSRERVSDIYLRRQKGEPVPSRYEFSIIRKDGEKRQIEISSSVIRNAAGRTETLAQLRDVTERKRAEEELKASEEKFRILFEYAPDAYYMNDLEGNFLDGNIAAEKILGYRREELAGGSFLSLGLLSAGQLPQATALLAQGMLGQVTGPDEFVLTRKDKSEVPVEIRTYPLKMNGKTLVLGIARDVTERKRAEGELRRIAWMLNRGGRPASSAQNPEEHGQPAVENLVDLNTSRVILDAAGTETLQDIMQDYLDLLDTSVAVYETNGDYAHAISSSSWCRFMRQASRRLCGSVDTRAALAGGMWQCHESCWTLSSKAAIETNKPVDIECHGGIRCYAVPIRAGDEIVGSIKIGYADPPRDPARLQELAAAFGVGVSELAEHAGAYESRPPYIVEMAKRRLEASARLIGEIVDRRRTEEKLRKSKEEVNFLAGLLESSEQPFSIGYIDGRLGRCNSAYLKLLGYGREELDHLNWARDLTPSIWLPGESAKLEELLRGGKPVRYEKEYIRKDETRVPIELLVHLARDDNGEPRYYYSFITDITERKRAESELKTSLENLRKITGATVQAIASAVEARDPYTAGHQKRMADLARSIAKEMRLPQDKIEGIRTAGVIHDLGKLSIPAEILSKPSRLTDIEFSLIKTHAERGYEILKDISFPWPVARIVREHHERADGSGYPRGLKGEEILIESRILAVADVVEAIASHRPYRPSKGIDAALQEIQANRGLSFDAEVVDSCLRIFRNGYHFPAGDEWKHP